jgi:hypothetical protein
MTDRIIDYVTGREVMNIGAEANRQAVERLLVDEKRFLREDIEVDAPIDIDIDGQLYRSCVDLVVSVNGKRIVAVKCAAGSLGSREREILAAARLIDAYQLPLSLVSDGTTAVILDTASGHRLGQGLAEIPMKSRLVDDFETLVFQPLPDHRRRREMLIFRSYDSMNVNVARQS